MLEIIMWSMLAFFGAFGLIEFIRFVYTDWHNSQDNYHVVISTKNKEENIESIIRSTALATNSPSVIVIDDNSSEQTKMILEKLKVQYSYIRVVTFDEYMDFLQSKEC